MAKQDTFPFSPTKWIEKMDEYDLEIQGVWITIKCRLFWCETRGRATKTLKEWSRILKKSERKSLEILKYLLAKKIANGNVLDNQNITIIDDEMVELDRISKLRQVVGKMGGNPTLKNVLDNQTPNQKSTKTSTHRLTNDISPVHKESLNSIKYNTSAHTWENITEEDMRVWKTAYPNVNIQSELNKAAAWIASNPKKQKKDYKRFLNGWLGRALPSSDGPQPRNQTRYVTVEELLSD